MEISAHRNCCGVTHISSFGYDPTAQHGQGQTYLQKLDEILGGRDRRRTYEIVLNGRQNDVWGQLIIDRGGVKVAEAVNSIHNSRIHTYFFNDDLTLYGNRPQPAVQVPVRPEAPDAQGNLPNYAPASRVPVGTRVQLNDRAYFGATNLMFGTVTRTARNAEAAEGPSYTIRLDNGHDARECFIHRVRPVNAAGAAAVPEARVYTHVYVDPAGANRFHGRLMQIVRVNGANATVWVQGQAGQETCASLRLRTIADLILPRPMAAPAPVPARQEAPPVRQERREILTEVFANVRALGLRGPFPGLFEAREAYPRVRRFDRRVIFNDGTIENQENIDA